MSEHFWVPQRHWTAGSSRTDSRGGQKRLWAVNNSPTPRLLLWMCTFYHPHDLWIDTFYHPRSYRSITHAYFVLSPTQSVVLINGDNGLRNLNPRARL